ncbi:MAG: type VI secretion system baseplate subunit TssF, partial [Chitinivibrionales bacterium]|nr:type VI secretion system baseplate subunit TssF [Chitinivibrionales bacterium]MBD3358478.1 type VI secretion system baseplate subunit TssF [Chitinivibrionales bacterium]
MHEDLFPYYENELTYLRRFAGEFAKRYPAAASALQVEADRCLDPHVELLLQGSALLSGRIRRKLDDEFPELAESMLSLLYPHLLDPIPAVGILQFRVSRENSNLNSLYHVPAGTALASKQTASMDCMFRTCYPVDLVPLVVESSHIEMCRGHGVTEKMGLGRAQACLSLGLEVIGVPPKEIPLTSLRVHLHGAPMSYRLYEILGETVVGVEVEYECDKGGHKKILGPDCIQPVGFGPDEGLLPCPPRSFFGYRLLQEYFAFPQKFLFYDIIFGDDGEIPVNCRRMVLNFYLRTMPEHARDIAAEQFVLGCTPIINLFEKWCEPFKTDPAKREYRIIPESAGGHAYEVYSVDEVEATNLDTGASRSFEPFYSFRHALDSETSTYWYTRREPGLDGAFETYLNLCTLGYA